jgi:hypothetical protein
MIDSAGVWAMKGRRKAMRRQCFGPIMQPRWLSIAVHWTQCQGAERLAACSLWIQPPSGALDRVPERVNDFETVGF